ncbi:MAG: hypothetical protein SYC29_13495, partial [Planctomycetota bacterium]|nr:hypothetical protein [Planctomycetota bacterium]
MDERRAVTSEADGRPASGKGAPRRAAIVAIAIIIFAILVWPLVLTGARGTSEAWDQRRYHRPVIDTMIEQWPRPDLADYDSATTPGYHLLLALIGKYISPSAIVFQFTGSLFSLALLLVVLRWVLRRVGDWRALALIAPLPASSYFLGGAIWLTTDNAGWLFAALALGGSAMLAPTPGRAARWGLYVTLGVFIRQIHLWVMAPVGLATLLMSPAGAAAPRLLRGPDDQPRAWGRFLSPLPLVIAPLIVVIVFALLWGGLVPPAYAQQHASG